MKPRLKKFSPSHRYKWAVYVGDSFAGYVVKNASSGEYYNNATFTSHRTRSGAVSELVKQT